MQLLVVRHALAGERADWAATGRPDEERPVTSRGRSRMKRNAAGIARLFPKLDLIATSPLVRAAQTAEILAHAYPKAATTTVAALASGGSRNEVVSWLASRPRDERISIVGHEPDLGELVAWLVTGRVAPSLPMRKGGACLLEIDGAPGRAAAELKWFATPSLLRAMRKR